MNKRFGRVAVDSSKIGSALDDKMAGKSTSPAQSPPLITRAKSFAIIAGKHLRLSRKKGSSDVNQQVNSPLFNQLPQELRDKIWEYVFAAPKLAKPAHFHIYNEVYDACNYQSPKDGVSELRASLRKSQTHIALLQTCRAIYNEALPYLFKDANFTFVVLAGRPRPHKASWEGCKSLGTMRDCEALFRRIRNLTIVVQPGKNPHVELYASRLSALLKALDHGKSLVSLNIIFNYRLEITEYDPEHFRRRKIVQALHPLQEHLAPKVQVGKCKLTILAWADEKDTLEDYDEDHEDLSVVPTVNLLRTLGGINEDFILVRSDRQSPNAPKCQLIDWDPTIPDDKHRCIKFGAEMCCLERGAFGEDYYALKQLAPRPNTPMNVWFLPNRVSKEDLELAAFLGIWIVTAPLSAPVTAWAIINRKKTKGEWK